MNTYTFRLLPCHQSEESSGISGDGWCADQIASWPAVGRRGFSGQLLRPTAS